MQEAVEQVGNTGERRRKGAAALGGLCSPGTVTHALTAARPHSRTPSARGGPGSHTPRPARPTMLCEGSVSAGFRPAARAAPTQARLQRRTAPRLASGSAGSTFSPVIGCPLLSLYGPPPPVANRVSIGRRGELRGASCAGWLSGLSVCAVTRQRVTVRRFPRQCEGAEPVSLPVPRGPRAPRPRLRRRRQGGAERGRAEPSRPRCRPPGYVKRPPPRGTGAAILDAGVSAGQRPPVAILSRRGGGREGSGGGGTLRDRRGAGTGPRQPRGPGAGGGGGRPSGRPGLTRVAVPTGRGREGPPGNGRRGLRGAAGPGPGPGRSELRDGRCTCPPSAPHARGACCLQSVSAGSSWPMVSSWLWRGKAQSPLSVCVMSSSGDMFHSFNSMK